MRILLLGGTGEARALAARLHPGTDIVSSLAGRVPDPALPVGPVRIGGFGGVDGLAQWLRDNGIGAVVDATHPFAATMTAHAAQACADLNLPHVVLARPPWDPAGAITVKSDVEAADTVARQGYSRVFLTTGRSGVAPFADSDAWFLIRVVTAPDSEVLPARHRVLLSRGPYDYAGERTLLQDNNIDALVTKNSGGELTNAKLHAAHDLGVAIVMIERPPLPAGVRTVGTVGEAADWVQQLS
ncbi:cobalt-precorrin-6A reductase [Mycobacterium sp. DL592]|uniref:cobalt-precorrin-6A reductase n=1 Tax=Mycobacterium sp. DL592 TaxID=2675524 RepID=UPI001423EBF4|nr:cobalt-precorrin-6A reductase [Mycobacterium sp. DL592]